MNNEQKNHVRMLFRNGYIQSTGIGTFVADAVDTEIYHILDKLHNQGIIVSMSNNGEQIYMRFCNEAQELLTRLEM